VTGHTSEGIAAVVEDGPVPLVPFGPSNNASATVWHRHDAARFPDRGVMPEVDGMMPPVGGSQFLVSVLAPGGGEELNAAIQSGFGLYADQDDPGMHRTPSMDYIVVLEGSVGLELDQSEVVLGPGDVVVQNGTRHRWHNRGDTPARLAFVMIGAEHDLKGGGPALGDGRAEDADDAQSRE
jgi:mannose-6-phosphate isomerase-like protein (cupin superfamily)